MDRNTHIIESDFGERVAGGESVHVEFAVEELLR